MSRWKRYSTYKNSGVEWLNEIPSHWEMIPNSTLFRQRDQRRRADLPILEVSIAFGVRVRQFSEAKVEQRSDDLGSYKVAAAGDIAFNKMRMWQGAVGVAPESGLVSPDYIVATPRTGVEPAYYSSVFRTPLYMGEVYRRSHGIVDDRNRLYWSDFKAICSPFPPLTEQRTIIAFLHRETTKIDALVAKKERLIELLKDRRTALITQAVTQGLAPDVSTQDSRVAWLGRIPAHWDVCRIKHVAQLRSGHTPSRQVAEYWVDCTIPWFGLADVWQLRDSRRDYVAETAEKISQLGLANSAARLLPAGTVMVSRTASVGFSGIMAIDMATTQDFVNWVCGPRLRPEYLLYVFRSMRQEFQRLTMGSTHQTIYMPDVGTFATPVPPLSEQDQIVAFVRREVATIDDVVDKVATAITRLKELRTALISAAVTGKIDVRDTPA